MAFEMSDTSASIQGILTALLKDVVQRHANRAESLGDAFLAQLSPGRNSSLKRSFYLFL